MILCGEARPCTHKSCATSSSDSEPYGYLPALLHSPISLTFLPKGSSQYCGLLARPMKALKDLDPIVGLKTCKQQTSLMSRPATRDVRQQPARKQVETRLASNPMESHLAHNRSHVLFVLTLKLTTQLWQVQEANKAFTVR